MDFRTRQLAKARDSLAMAQSNFDACEAALRNAVHEALIERLQAACKLEGYHSDVAPTVVHLLDAIADSRAALARARLAAVDIESRFEQLCLATRAYQEAKGEPVTDLNAATKAAPVLLRMLEAGGPDCALPLGWWHKADDLVEVAWLEPVSCRTPRSRLEDLAILSLDPRYEAELARLNAAEESELKAAGEAQSLADQQAAEVEAKRKHEELVARLRKTPDTDPRYPGRMMSDLYKIDSRHCAVPGFGTVVIESWKDPCNRDPKHVIKKPVLDPFDANRHGGIREVLPPVEVEKLRFEIVVCKDGSRHVRQIEESKPSLLSRAVNALVDAVSPTT